MWGRPAVQPHAVITPGALVGVMCAGCCPPRVNIQHLSPPVPSRHTRWGLKGVGVGWFHRVFIQEPSPTSRSNTLHTHPEDTHAHKQPPHIQPASHAHTYTARAYTHTGTHTNIHTNYVPWVIKLRKLIFSERKRNATLTPNQACLLSNFIFVI